MSEIKTYVKVDLPVFIHVDTNDEGDLILYVLENGKMITRDRVICDGIILEKDDKSWLLKVYEKTKRR